MLRMIASIIENDGVTKTTTRGILHIFVEFPQSKYERIHVDAAGVTQKEKDGHRTLPLGWTDFLDTPITEELKAAVSKRELLTKLREEMASAWNILKSNGTTSRMTCWPYSTRCT